MNGKYVLSGVFTEFDLKNRSHRFYTSVLYSKYLRNITRISKIKKMELKSDLR